MSDSIVFLKREDNSTEDAETVVEWVRQFKGADAHIVMDYITSGSVEFGNLQMLPGALNGVTIQWDHDDDGDADEAVHARPGATVTRVKGGFTVENLPIVVEVRDEFGHPVLDELGEVQMREVPQ